MTAPPPPHVDVIREALRQAEAEAYPGDLAVPYREAFRALTEGEIVLVTASPPFGETGPTKDCGCGPDEPCEEHADRSAPGEGFLP